MFNHNTKSSFCKNIEKSRLTVCEILRNLRYLAGVGVGEGGEEFTLKTALLDLHRDKRRDSVPCNCSSGRTV
jgi:hypothetical protein